MTSVCRRFLGAFVTLLPAVAMAAPITTQGTWYGTNGWDGTLRGRDAAGNPVNLLDASATAPNPSLKYVYDTVLGLTWLADWNAGAGSSFDDGSNASDGKMTWINAKGWAASLTDFGGGWVLPSVVDIDNDGCGGSFPFRDCGFNVYGSENTRRGSPLAHMFYDSLGNEGYHDVNGAYNFWSSVGWGLTNTGPFHAMQPDVYWSGTAYAPSPNTTAWIFDNYNGNQHRAIFSPFFVVAVRPGEVLSPLAANAIPEPTPVGLLGLAFGALALVRRRAH
jgi:hypothetical protein